MVSRVADWPLILNLLLFSASLCFLAASSLDCWFDFGLQREFLKLMMAVCAVQVGLITPPLPKLICFIEAPERRLLRTDCMISCPILSVSNYIVIQAQINTYLYRN